MTADIPPLPYKLRDQIENKNLLDYAEEIWQAERPLLKLRAAGGRLQRARRAKKAAYARIKALILPARKAGYSVQEIRKYSGLSNVTIIGVHSIEDAYFDDMTEEEQAEIERYFNTPPVLGPELSALLVGLGKSVREHARSERNAAEHVKVAGIVAAARGGFSEYTLARELGITRVTLRRYLGKAN